MCALLPGGLPAVRAAEGAPPPAEQADTLTDTVPQEAAEQPDAGPAPLAAQPRAASRTVDLTVEAAAHCTVYYSEGKNLQQVEAGTKIIRTTAGPYGIVFFAAPEEGYALTVLAAVSTQQKYYTISNWSDDGSGMTAAEQAACDEYVDALKDHAGFTDEQLRSMVSQARALGCDGSLMFTRGADNSYGINSTLQFRAERLPTLEKEILSVTGADVVETPYQPGMSVGAGDVVTYGLTVTAYALEYPVDSVYYTGVTVTDPKTGNGAEDPIPFTLPGKKELMELKEDREITREVTYTVTQADADAGTLSNEAQLHFQYASIYSAGSLSTTSSAQATVLVRSPVRYAYVSADPDLELPWELANLAPADPAAYDYHALTAAEQGLRFAAGSFSPYVLVWEEPEGGAVLPGGDDDDDDESGSREEAPAPSGLNTGDHLAYLMGRGDGGLQPQAPITRGEVAAILFRLLSDEALAAHWSTETVYPDLPEGTWNHNAVATLTAMGIVEGYPNGDFGSNDLISRAELVTMAVRFFQPAETAGQTFPDVPAEAWYADAVATAAALGLVKGQDDGTFGPERPITRAETAAILNRALGRTPGTGELPDWAEGWTDVPADAWYDGDMLEAALSHRFTWTETPDGRAELWTAPMEEPDWAALERYGPDALK